MIGEWLAWMMSRDEYYYLCWRKWEKENEQLERLDHEALADILMHRHLRWVSYPAEYNGNVDVSPFDPIRTAVTNDIKELIYQKKISSGKLIFIGFRRGPDEVDDEGFNKHFLFHVKLNHWDIEFSPRCKLSTKGGVWGYVMDDIAVDAPKIAEDSWPSFFGI